jgi:hypothetical protein
MLSVWYINVKSEKTPLAPEEIEYRTIIWP